MKDRKLHYAACSPGGGLGPACGVDSLAALVTPDVRFVECKKCKRWLDDCESTEES